MSDFLWADWPAPANVRAVMTTRTGGVSLGPYSSLNLGGRGGDDPAAVSENRRRAFAKLKVPAPPGWLHQVHGSQVVCAPLHGREPDADAVFSLEPNVVCLVQTADCLPVLFCDDTGTVVAAAHAGWRGLAAGVLEETVRTMPVPPQKLLAWMGAAIGPAAFEVGAEVREAFLHNDAAAASAFKESSPGKYLADIFLLARQRLHAAGVSRIYGGGVCTYCDATRFFSYRRDRVTGRMAALIWRVE